MPTLPSRKEAREIVAGLAKEFLRQRAAFKDRHIYDEAKVRAGFIDPFFEALGWPVRSGQRQVGRAREVVVEDRAGKGNRRRPDYGFYFGGDLKFYVEAKQPSKEIATDTDAIYQLKSYVWSQRAPLGILTDFEELLTFHGAYKPRHDKPALGRLDRLCLGCDAYADQFDLIYDTLSHEAVAGGAVERLIAELLAQTARQRGQLERDLFKARGAVAVDDDFLESLTRWREELAKELARRNQFRDGAELTEAVQRFLDRLVFARVAEDRGIERNLTLRSAVEHWERDGRRQPLYRYLIDTFNRMAPQFNGGLFAPHPLSDRAEFTDDKALHRIIESLYFPECAYRFDVMPVELLGAVYEQFLGSVVRVTEGGRRAKVEVKPEVRHAGGVYYTPRHIVEAIIERTLGPLTSEANSKTILDLKIVDPACGSGSFLLGAYQYLIDWHLRYFGKAEDPPKSYRNACYFDQDQNLRLTLQRKREILTSCIFGADLDPQAVEVAQMSLYMKLLEDEAEETLALQRSLELFKADKYLPDLSKNMRSGNSLLEPKDVSDLALREEDLRRINAMDWKAQETGFGQITGPLEAGGRGGFDAVIGNPPYIRVQALTEWAPQEVALYKRRYRTAAEGNYDIYVPFIERSLELLRPGGRLGFIVPSKWWQAAYGAALRGILRTGRHYQEILDFGDEQVFEDPTTYTCVSVFTKSPSSAVRYQRVSPNALRKHGPSAKPLHGHDLTWDDLDEGAWYPGIPATLRPLFDRLRRQGPFLGDETICSRVFQGLKTSLDPVYVLEVIEEGKGTLKLRSKALEQEVHLEREFLKPLVKGREMKRFAPLPPRKVVLFPYESSPQTGGMSLVAARDLERRAPRTWKYLVENRPALDAREKGRFRGPAWYQYGRTQALEVVGLPKILTADLADRMAFSLDADGRYFLLGGAAGGYGILPARREYMGPLLALLNSTVLEWMLRPPGLSSPFRGGWFSCEARFINLLPIRLPGSPADLKSLRDLALHASSAYAKLWSARSDRDKDLAARQIESIEGDIDDRVFSLYGLTPDERRVVHQSVKEARVSVAPADTIDEHEE